DLHRIMPGLGVEETIVADSVRLDGANRAFFRVGKRDGCVGNHGAGSILYGADDSALCRLGVALHAGQSEYQERAENGQCRPLKSLLEIGVALKHRSLSPKNDACVGFCWLRGKDGIGGDAASISE